MKTKNTVWTTQPEQQLAYAGARIWGRRHCPEVLMGLLFEGEQPMIDVTPAEVKSEAARQEHTPGVPGGYANRAPVEKPEPPATSGDQYALQWQVHIQNAVAADELQMKWNSERLLRNNIDWHDAEQPARLKEMVTHRIEQLKLARTAADDSE